MRSLRTHWLALLALLGGVLFSIQPALAVDCGGDVSTSGTLTGGAVDPFQPTTSTVNGTLTVTRTNIAGGGKTQTYAFYLVPIGGALPGNPTVDVGSTNILNNSNPLVASSPDSPLTTPQGNFAAFAGSPSGFLELGFGGNSLTDVTTVPVTFSLGSLGSLAAGPQTVNFQIYFICKGTGGTGSVSDPRLGSGNVSVTLTVMSALQASFQGTSLDFGELGNQTAGGSNAAVIGGTGLRVASSGPYSVDVASLNNYKLTFPGGNLGNSTNTIAYQLDFLGETPDSSTPFTTKVCHPATVAGQNLGLQATTLEGGAAKIPSQQYGDTLTVTFTPLVIASDAGASSCL